MTVDTNHEGRRWDNLPANKAMQRTGFAGR